MRSLAVFIVVLMCCSILGCAKEEKKPTEPGEVSGDYTGFLMLKGGEWAEYTMTGGRTRYEYLGTDNYKGTECILLEFHTTFSGMESISQIWIDKAKTKAVLFVVKQAGIVMKMEIGELPEVSQGMSETPSEYTPGKEVGIETYKTPTGKEVKSAVFKFTSKDGHVHEEWVSAKVPFGIVKSIIDGTTTMELYDFASSGAKRDISKEEAENAISMFDIPQ